MARILEHQRNAYDLARKEIGRAAEIVSAINIARLNEDDKERLSDVLSTLRQLRAEFYRSDCERYLDSE